MVDERRKRMSSMTIFLWLLSICKRRFNGLALQTKAIFLSCWIFETCMSLNQKEVVRKIIAPRVYDEKPTQYFTESQVFFINICSSC
jgi:hypothetical protein